MPVLYTASQIISYPDENYSVHWLVSKRHGKSGIGIKSISSAAQHTIEYKLINYELGQSLLPTIEGDELIWSNRSCIEITDEINETLWETSIHICTIDNNTLVEMQQWLIQNWIPKNPIYSLIGSSMMPSSTCDLFSSNVIAFLTSKGTTEKVSIIPPKYLSYQLSSASFTTVDYEIEKPEINKYFSTLSLTLSRLSTETPAEHIKRIISVINSFETIYLLGYHQPGLVGYWKFVKPVITAIPQPIKLTPRAPSHQIKTSTPPVPIQTASVFTLNSSVDPQPIQPITTPNRAWPIILAIIIIIIIILIVFFLVYLAG
ncbi:Hypothetical protein POVR1_LOCUS459 [uncultured virus]|nr:Hypothetical protein POVR1_LOCUS459 [uncultured virus]